MNGGKIEKIVIVPCRLTIVQLLGWNKFSFADINWKFEREWLRRKHIRVSELQWECFFEITTILKCSWSASFAAKMRTNLFSRLKTRFSAKQFRQYSASHFHLRFIIERKPSNFLFEYNKKQEMWWLLCISFAKWQFYLAQQASLTTNGERSWRKIGEWFDDFCFPL